MTKPPPAYTDKQLKTLDILQRNRMAWIMFWFLLVVFTIILIALVVSVFFVTVAGWLKIAFALLDGVIGLGLKRVVYYLFPTIPRRPITG